jgi:hypothetical protein
VGDCTNRAIDVVFFRDIDRIRAAIMLISATALNAVAGSGWYFRHAGSRAPDGMWSNEAGSPAANNHSNTSINEPGAKMSTKTGTISVLAKSMSQRITQISAKLAQLLLRTRKSTRKSIVILTSGTNSTAAEPAEMSATEGKNKHLQGHRKTHQPYACRPLRPEHPQLLRRATKHIEPDKNSDLESKTGIRNTVSDACRRTTVNGDRD